MQRQKVREYHCQPFPKQLWVMGVGVVAHYSCFIILTTHSTHLSKSFHLTLRPRPPVQISHPLLCADYSLTSLVSYVNKLFLQGHWYNKAISASKESSQLTVHHVPCCTAVDLGQQQPSSLAMVSAREGRARVTFIFKTLDWNCKCQSRQIEESRETDLCWPISVVTCEEKRVCKYNVIQVKPILTSQNIERSVSQSTDAAV